MFTHTCPLPDGGAFCVAGDDPPVEDFVDFGEAAGAEFEAELDAGADAGVAVGLAAGAAEAEAAGAELLPEPEELAEAFAGVVSRFERDFFVLEAVLSLAAEELDAAVDDFEASADASLDASAVFFDRDFLVVPAEASADLDASAEASEESAAAFFDRDFFVVLPLDASAEESVEASAVFFERDFFVVPVDESDPDADESASAVDFFFFDFDVPLVEESLELALESLDVSDAAFFFFLAFVVPVLESELELLVSCAFVAMAPTEISASTKPVLASATRAFCHNVFMVVPPVSSAACRKSVTKRT